MKELMEAASALSHALNLSSCNTKDDARFQRKGVILDPDNPYGLEGRPMTATDKDGKVRNVLFIEI